MRWLVAGRRLAPQTNVTRSPGRSSTMSSRNWPMRSFGPGQVLQDRDRRPARLGRLAHALGDLGVLLGRCRGRS